MTSESLRRTDHSLFDNRWYHPGAGTLKNIAWYFVNHLFVHNPLIPVSSLKLAVLRLFGAKIGQGVVLKPGVNIKYPWRLSIGDHAWIGENVWIDNLADVHIGAHVCISQGAMLLTGSHNYKKTAFDLQIGEIRLEDGAWVGAQSVVCPGVVCGTHSVLAVLSVATSALEPYTIYQGNPALPKRKRVISE